MRRWRVMMAKEIFRFTGEMLGEAFADFVAFSSPEAIILSVVSPKQVI